MYRVWLRVAERYATGPESAADLVHDVLTRALGRGIDDWETPARQAWMRGALRKHAAFVARTAARRRAREETASVPDTEPMAARRLSPAALARLPKSLRRLATLLSADLRREELLYLLGISDQAFRQRLSAFRRVLRGIGDDDLAPQPPAPSTDGRRRAPLIDAAARHQGGRVVGTHDPDGHLLLFVE